MPYTMPTILKLVAISVVKYIDHENVYNVLYKTAKPRKKTHKIIRELENVTKNLHTHTQQRRVIHRNSFWNSCFLRGAPPIIACRCICARGGKNSTTFLYHNASWCCWHTLIWVACAQMTFDSAKLPAKNKWKKQCKTFDEIWWNGCWIDRCIQRNVLSEYFPA